MVADQEQRDSFVQEALKRGRQLFENKGPRGIVDDPQAMKSALAEFEEYRLKGDLTCIGCNQPIAEPNGYMLVQIPMFEKDHIVCAIHKTESCRKKFEADLEAKGRAAKPIISPIMFGDDLEMTVVVIGTRLGEVPWVEIRYPSRELLKEHQRGLAQQLGAEDYHLSKQLRPLCNAFRESAVYNRLYVDDCRLATNFGFSMETIPDREAVICKLRADTYGGWQTSAEVGLGPTWVARVRAAFELCGAVFILLGYGGEGDPVHPVAYYVTKLIYIDRD